MAGIDPRFYYLTLGLLALCTLVGVVVIYKFQREVEDDLAPPTEKDLLGPLEKAYYSGLMREEEFQRIQESMARQKGEHPVGAAKLSKLRVKPSAGGGGESPPKLASEAGSAEAPTEEPPPAITPTDGSDPGPSLD